MNKNIYIGCERVTGHRAASGELRMANNTKEGVLIKTGFKLSAGRGKSCVVEEFLGGGGQGEVYKARIGRESVALKWYFRQTQKPELKNSIEELIKKGPPSDNFLWPRQIITHGGDFGYTMGLRPPEYLKSQKLLDRTFSLGYRTAANACLQLADSFRKLHIKGLSYQDLNWGNLFINPAAGDILICDNDNVSAHGVSNAGIAGTYGFMAPEVVRGERLPDTYSDLFSMAVLMFRMLFIDHPFDGRRWVNTQAWDDIAKKKYYGEIPLFIFDPADDSNRPVRGVQDNAYLFWGLYPQFLRDTFTQVFTTGLKDRENGRLLEEDWIDVFRRLRESLFPCPYCGADIVYDAAALKRNGKITCWKPKCRGYGNRLPIPPRLRIKAGSRERIVILNADTKIYKYQAVKSEPDLSAGGAVIGETAQNPGDPAKWGLRNKSGDTWKYTTGGGETADVVPGKALSLAANVKGIDFITAKAEIIF